MTKTGFVPYDENEAGISLAEKVRRMIANQLAIPKEQVTDVASFEEDLRADSLTRVELLMALEEKLELPDIPEEDADTLKTVGDVIRYVEAKKA